MGLRRILPLLLLAACTGEPIADHDLHVEVAVPADGVDFGRAFPLSVTRIWRRELVPEAFDDRALSPLVVRLVETRRRDDGRRFEETRVYEARAFERSDVRLAPVLRARPGGVGAEVTATAAAVTISVRPSLDPMKPGTVELPCAPLVPPLSFWQRRGPLVLGGLAAAIAVSVFALRRSRSRRAPPPTPPAPVAAEDAPALRRLRALGKALPPDDADLVRAFYVALSDIVREHVRDRTAIAALERTTEELLATEALASSLGAAPRDLLREILGRCDLVKFSGALPAAAARAGILEDGLRFVADTSTGAPPRPAPARSAS